MSDFDNLNSLYDFYSTRCERYAGEMLFDNIITYGQAFEYASARAAFLQKSGYKKGDVVGLLAVNGPEWCITYMAITMTGAVVLPLDNNLPPEKYPSMLKETGCGAVFVSDEYAGSVRRVKKYSVDLKKSVEYKKKFRPVRMKPDDLAALVFTSGTTGTSKIVMLSQENIYYIAVGCSNFMNFAPGDVNLCLLPLFHVYALCANFTGPFSYGGALVFIQSLKGPDIMKALAENPITVFPAAPQLWELFMEAILNRVKGQSMTKYRVFMFFLNSAPFLRLIGLDFLLKKVFAPVHEIFGASHRAFISGGAAMKGRYLKYYSNLGFTLIEGYGLTETTGPITLDDYKNPAMGSVGAATTGNEIRIKNINSDGIGDVCLRGSGVMPGYYKNEAANRAVFDEEGFFHTGDLGRLNRKGKLFITGRSKNVIVLPSGKNVYPEELESHYRQSPEIAEIAVFERKIDGKETVYSVIVPRSKAKNSYEKIGAEIKRLNAGLPGYKTISGFAISYDPLPVNTTKKILYREVADNLEKGLYQEHNEDFAVLQSELLPQDPGDEVIISALCGRFRQDRIFSNQTLRDFNVDSLGLVDLAMYLEEKLGVSIDMKDLQKKETFEDLLVYLRTLEKNRGQSLDKMIFEGEITRKARKFINPIHYLVLGILQLLSKAFWGVTVKNRDRMNFDNNIIIANHESYLDMIWLAWAFPYAKRSNIYITGKKKMSFLGMIFPMLPVIWIEEDNAIDVLKASADLLRQGKSLMIFPEGTRSVDGKMQPFKIGAAYLAKGLNRKVVPVTVNGAFENWPRSSSLPVFRSGIKGSITVGEEIDPSAYKTVEKLNRALEKAVAKNLD